MSVVVVVYGQVMIQAPGLSATGEKRKKLEKEKPPASKLAKSSTDKPAESSAYSRSFKAFTDARIDELDQKWSDRFSRFMEALLMARTPTTGLPTPSTSQPTKHFFSQPTDQLLQICLEPTLLLQSSSLSANPTLTDLRKWANQGRLSELAPTPLFYRGRLPAKLLR